MPAVINWESVERRKHWAVYGEWGWTLTGPPACLTSEAERGPGRALAPGEDGGDTSPAGTHAHAHAPVGRAQDATRVVRLAQHNVHDAKRGVRFAEHDLYIVYGEGADETSDSGLESESESESDSESEVDSEATLVELDLAAPVPVLDDNANADADTDPTAIVPSLTRGQWDWPAVADDQDGHGPCAERD